MTITAWQIQEMNLITLKGDVMITPRQAPQPSEPKTYETITYRDMDIQYGSGLITLCLVDADRVDEYSDRITVHIQESEKVHVFYRDRMDWWSMSKRVHRRVVDLKGALRRASEEAQKDQDSQRG